MVGKLPIRGSLTHLVDSSRAKECIDASLRRDDLHASKVEDDDLRGDWPPVPRPGTLHAHVCDLLLSHVPSHQLLVWKMLQQLGYLYFPCPLMVTNGINHKRAAAHSADMAEHVNRRKVE